MIIYDIYISPAIENKYLYTTPKSDYFFLKTALKKQAKIKENYIGNIMTEYTISLSWTYKGRKVELFTSDYNNLNLWIYGPIITSKTKNRIFDFIKNSLNNTYKDSFTVYEELYNDSCSLKNRYCVGGLRITLKNN